MKSALIIGDSYSAAREGDTQLDRGWPALLGVSAAWRQAVSGSTAAQWAGDYQGWLSRAKGTACDAVIMSLLGNDAFQAAPGLQSNPAAAVVAVAEAYKNMETVLAVVYRQPIFVLLYPDAYNGKNSVWNFGLPMLNGAVRHAVAVAAPNAVLVDLGTILSPQDFNGVDYHPIQSGHVKIAAYFSKLLN